jgi:large subunit ribosomal protein L44
MHKRRAIANVARLAGVRQLVTSTVRCMRQPHFPPRELNPRVIRDASEPLVDPNIWLSVQLPPESALAAFAHRAGFGDILDHPSKVLQACVHPTFVPYFEHHTNPSSPLSHNGSLSPLGNTLLGLFAAERLHLTYPHLPTRVLKAAVTGFVGSTTCAAVARSLGATPLVRWRRTSPTLSSPGVLLDDALASIPRALVAILYHQGSIDAARAFFDKFFMSRELDIRSLIKFRDPKLVLKDTVAYFKRERPVSR